VRLVDVCGFYSPHGGGIRTYVEEKLRLAERLGQDITILAPGGADATIDFGPSARIMTIASPRFPLDRKYFSFTDQQAVHRALDLLQPDFVEASSPWNSANYVAAWPRATPRSLVMHSEPLSAHAYRWFERIVEPPAVDRAFDWFWQRLRRYGKVFDAVIVANSSLAQRLASGGVDKIMTVPMGVQPGLFSPSRRDEALRNRLLALCALGPEATLLMCAGRLATEKRVPMLVEAATIAGRRRPIGLVIFGEGRSHKEVLRAIAGNPHVRLLQPVRERAQFATILASADALLHGCEAETFGMIAAEAQASGIPLVAPDMGGAGDFVRDTALGFRPADTFDVVRAILELPLGARKAVTPRTPRSMEDHFRELYRLYASLGSDARTIAA
jgi:alpha-1,6-mannosyltransferase